MIRFIDLTFATAAIVLLSPLLIPIPILLLLTGEHKIFYKQTRVGRKGHLFSLLKFATMLENSPNLPGGDITSGNDPRVLPFGRFLRKTKINEMPQLFNVLLGDISIVGPRPLTPKNFSFYSDDIQDIIKKLRPGLTGIGSIVFRDEEAVLAKSLKQPVECYKEDISPYKGELEKWFYNNNSLITYFMIIFVTAHAVLFPKSRVVWKIFIDLPRPNNNLGLYKS